MAGAELALAPPRERRDRARIAGVDEAGRGPLAGPVVAAAVILDPRRRIRGLADSKLLTAEERERLALLIRARALAFGIGWADRDEIDCLNILEATLLAMRRALLALPVCPTHVQVDGNRCPWLADLPLPCTLEAIVQGCARQCDQRGFDPGQGASRCDDARARCVLSGLRARAPQGLRHAGAPRGSRPPSPFAPAPPLVQSAAALRGSLRVRCRRLSSNSGCTPNTRSATASCGCRSSSPRWRG